MYKLIAVFFTFINNLNFTPRAHELSLGRGHWWVYSATLTWDYIFKPDFEEAKNLKKQSKAKRKLSFCDGYVKRKKKRKVKIDKSCDVYDTDLSKNTGSPSDDSLKTPTKANIEKDIKVNL